MNFKILVLVAVFVYCFRADSVALDNHRDALATYEEFEQKCQRKGVNYHDTLKAPAEKFRTHQQKLSKESLTEIFTGMQNGIEKNLVEVVSHYCETDETRSLISELLRAALLCFDENEHSTDKLENILKQSSSSFCNTRLLDNVFLLINKQCVQKALEDFERCLHYDPEKILSSPLVNLLHPLTMNLNENQCKFRKGQIMCVEDAVLRNCPSEESSRIYEGIAANRSEQLACDV